MRKTSSSPTQYHMNNFAHLVMVPPLDKVPRDVVRRFAAHLDRHVVPRHARYRLAIDEVLEHLVVLDHRRTSEMGIVVVDAGETTSTRANTLTLFLEMSTIF